jgi:uncharacterized membrane protein YcfT
LAARERMEWVDLAKGATMLLIVLLHTVLKHVDLLEWQIGLPLERAWGELNAFFAPVRMPLFLMLSGLLASSALARGGRQAFLRRVANPYLLYVLWFAINTVFLVIFDFTAQENLTEVSAAALLRNLVFPQTTLWYMLALTVFFLAAMLLRPLGPAVPIAASLVVSAAVYAGWIVLPDWTGLTESILRHFPLFLIGALVPALPRRVAAVRGVWPLVGAALFYVAMLLASRAGLKELFGYGPFTAIVGAMIGVLVAVRLTGLRRLSAILVWIGRRTLPIFVLHIPFLAVLHWLATGPAAALWDPLLTSTAVAAVYPLLVTVTGTAACLGVHALAERGRAGWLFALPIGKWPAATPRWEVTAANANATPPHDANAPGEGPAAHDDAPPHDDGPRPMTGRAR